MASLMAFTLRITLGYGSDKEAESVLNKACSRGSPSGISFFGSGSSGGFFGNASSASSTNSNFIVSSTSVRLSVERRYDLISRKQYQVQFAAVFVPPLIIESALEKVTANSKINAPGSCFWLKEPHTSKLASDLLPRIHPALTKYKICGIVVTSIAAEQNAPAEIVVLDLSSSSIQSFAEIVNETHGESMVDDVDAIIKVLPISRIIFSTFDPEDRLASTDMQQSTLLSTCPVCLHRIDPVRLGLPKPANQHLCSKFCPAPSLVGGTWESESPDSCQKQRFLKRWPRPARCAACSVIQHYWDNLKRQDESNQLFCAKCAMHQTLWVCLTCGFVGCGRYSNRHSVEHFTESGHRYALELATLRIWGYDDEDGGGYAHRVDLLDCPSSPPLAYPWMVYSRGAPAAASSSSRDATDVFSKHSMTGTPIIDLEKSPKKATMIGEEYEALLQSALEEQAQHYEGEISRLRADLTAALVDENSMTTQELQVISELKDDITRLRADIDHVGGDLLDAQAQEAGHRATSQRLLAEQQVANNLLAKITEEANVEHQEGKMQVEEMEQQISDLTANLKMRKQFSQSAELSNAQIFGTVSSDSKPAKRGKKKGRFFRK